MRKIVLLALLLVVLLVVPSCYGYTIRVGTWDTSGNTVQLYFADNEAQTLAGSGASSAADAVMNYAQSKKMTITRTTGSVEGEIRAHAIGWILNISRDHANPMDITMTDNMWFWHLLD